MRTPCFLAALLVLASCSVLKLDNGEPLALEQCADFEPGRTRRAEVLAAFGPPTDLASHGSGVALLYEYVHLDEHQIGVGLDGLGVVLGSSWLGAFKLSLGDSDSKRVAVVFLFDAEGVLSASGAGDWEEAFGRGGSIQIIIDVDTVVDTGTLRGRPRGLTWGLELLEPLPEASNQVHRADLELRGTPRSTGQRTLE